MEYLQKQNKTRGPWAKFPSSEQISHWLSADAMQYSSSIATLTKTEIWLYPKKVKGHPGIIIWTNLVDFASQMLYNKSQHLSFLGSGEDL